MTKNVILQELINIDKKIASNFTSIVNIADFQEIVIKTAVDYVKAKKGFIALSNRDHSNDFTIKAVINFEHSLKEVTKLNAKVLNKIISDRDEDSKILTDFSMKGFGKVSSLLVSKIKLKDAIVGYIFLFDKNKKNEEDEKEPLFTESDQFALEILSLHAGTVLDKIAVIDKIKFENEGIKKLQRYLPKKSISKIIDNNYNAAMTGKNDDVTILLCTIANLEEIFQKLKPHNVIQLLNEYFTIMTKVIFSFNGSISKFSGNDIMAAFGAPLLSPENALESLLAAMEMLRQVKKLKVSFKEKFNIDNFDVKIAINTGMVFYGNIGTAQRMEFTILGQATITAGKLQAYTSPDSIVLGQNTYERVKPIINVKSVKNIPMESEPAGFLKVYDVESEIKGKVYIKQENTVKSEYNIREFVRIPLKAVVSIGKKGERFDGILKDLSLGGSSLKAQGEYEQDEIITLDFKLSVDMEFKNISAIVKYIGKPKKSDKDTTTTNLGIKFVDLSDEDYIKLVNYIDRKCFMM
jgi:class 3 adenylate cyclase